MRNLPLLHGALADELLVGTTGVTREITPTIGMWPFGVGDLGLLAPRLLAVLALGVRASSLVRGIAVVVILIPRTRVFGVEVIIVIIEQCWITVVINNRPSRFWILALRVRAITRVGLDVVSDLALVTLLNAIKHCVIQGVGLSGLTRG